MTTDLLEELHVSSHRINRTNPQTKKLAAAAAVAALALTSAGMAAGAVSDAAADGLAKASEQSGLTLPQADNEHRADASGGAGTDEAASTDDVEAAGHHEDTHGAAVSELARTTTLEGAEKGAAIASLASDGRSDAEHGTEAEAAAAATTGAEASEAGAGNADSHRP